MFISCLSAPLATWFLFSKAIFPLGWRFSFLCTPCPTAVSQSWLHPTWPWLLAQNTMPLTYPEWGVSDRFTDRKVISLKAIWVQGEPVNDKVTLLPFPTIRSIDWLIRETLWVPYIMSLASQKMKDFHSITVELKESLSPLLGGFVFDWSIY